MLIFSLLGGTLLIYNLIEGFIQDFELGGGLQYLSGQSLHALRSGSMPS